MHRCTADDCEGHADLADLAPLGGIVVQGFQLIANGLAEILRELRHDRAVVPHHVQAGMNALDQQIRAADQALSHQSGTHHTRGERP